MQHTPRSFWASFAFVHRESLAFVLACPLLALVPVVFEFLQHVGEMHVGMYSSPDGAQAAAAHPLRMGLGLLKSLAIALPGYWMIRWLAYDHDAAAARRLDPRAVKLFAMVLALQMLLTCLSLFTFTEGPVAVGFAVFGFVFAVLAVRFTVGAPLGEWVSPIASVRQMARHLPWGLALTIAAMLPLMALHYALGIGAILAPDWAKWPMLVADALVVGWLAPLLMAINWVVANRAGPFAASATQA